MFDACTTRYHFDCSVRNSLGTRIDAAVWPWQTLTGPEQRTATLVPLERADWATLKRPFSAVGILARITEAGARPRRE